MVDIRLIRDMFMTDCVNSVKEKYPDISYSSYAKRNTAEFPFFQLYYEHIATDRSAIDSGSIDRYQFARFRVNVYDNSEDALVENVEDICFIISKVFSLGGWMKTQDSEVPNYADPSIYRRTMAFEAKLDQDGRPHKL